MAHQGVMKMDQRRAYDSVHHNVVEEILGAPNSLRSSLTKLWCLGNAKFSISINRELHAFCQGEGRTETWDPISSLLFVLVMEAFNRFIQYAVKNCSL